MGFKNDTNFSGWGWWFYIICVNGREQLPPCNWTQLLSFHLWKASLWSNCSAKDEGAHFAVSRIGMWYDGPSDVSSLSSPLSFLMGVRSWASICRSLWSVIFCGVGEAKKCLMFAVEFELELGVKGETGSDYSVSLRVRRETSGWWGMDWLISAVSFHDNGWKLCLFSLGPGERPSWYSEEADARLCHQSSVRLPNQRLAGGSHLNKLFWKHFFLS